MIKLHEIEKKLKEEYPKYSEKLGDEDPQKKLNDLFYNSILSLIKTAETAKNKPGFSKPFTPTRAPRKRNPFSGNS